MNRFLQYSFLFIIGIFTAIPLFSSISEINEENNTPVYFNYSWTGDEDHLFFNMKLISGLKLDKEYYKLKYENGYACGVTFSPLKDSHFVFKDNLFLKKIIVVVELKNNPENPYEVHFRILSKSLYEKNQDHTHTSQMEEKISQGTLINPCIDLDKKPALFLIQDSDTEGFIRFTNSFSYSLIPT